MISDCHMHTCFSDDSDTPVEAMAEQALRLGMRHICVTDHYDMDFPKGEFVLDTVPYLAALDRVREQFRGRLEIRRGVELGLQPQLTGSIRSYINEYDFDYVIGSVHLVCGVDPYNRDEVALSDDEMYRQYFQETLENVRNAEGIHSLGHLDYIVRCGYMREQGYSYYRYVDLIDEILRELVRKEIALEVNTGGLKYGLGAPNPCPEILKRYRELGGTMVTAGSDAHRPEHVGYQFQLLTQILFDAGFHYLTEFVGGKPEFIKI